MIDKTTDQNGVVLSAELKRCHHERKDFEAWLNPANHPGNVSPWVQPGRYEKETHQLAWLAWQASAVLTRERSAALCETMKTKPPGNDPDDAERGYNAALSRASSRIRGA